MDSLNLYLQIIIFSSYLINLTFLLKPFPDNNYNSKSNLEELFPKRLMSRDSESTLWTDFTEELKLNLNKTLNNATYLSQQCKNNIYKQRYNIYTQYIKQTINKYIQHR